MKGAALCSWAALLLLSLRGPAGGHPLSSKYSSRELQSLQDLIERLKEKIQGEEGGPLELESLDYGAEDDDPSWDLAEPASSPAAQLQPRDPVESQWRNLLASPRRMRHFSGCFGTRIERIGSQTGLGCNIFKARSWKRRSRS
ncbi:natriuretic peptides B-like [Terrapene carolina triunguis]|uniref:Natriuretic peptides B-like n=1 Tax=Terrapene triunguis TaxID=2587831 RepID=A0A674KCY7_9SAUR|nr:natriuretic peptides B-like [Terrapene carolina triunguis]